MKIIGWLFLLLTCLLPMLAGYVSHYGPMWLTSEAVMFSSGGLGLLFLCTGFALLQFNWREP